MDPVLRERRRDGYEAVRPEILERIPVRSQRVLDLGCSSGSLGSAIKARQPATVVGVELDPDYAADAEGVLDRVICADAAAALARDDLGSFDCIVAADVLEHLIDPWAALERAVELLEPGGAAVVSLPNVRYAKTLLELVWRGRWPREDAGLFDATHLRWFTDHDARALLEGAGLRVTGMHPSYWFSGRVLRLVEQLGRTPLQAFLAGQYVLVGAKDR